MNMEESNNGSLSAEFKHLVRGEAWNPFSESLWHRERLGQPRVTEVLFAFLTDPERAKMW